MLDRICWPYLAGFLDGDGWITEAHYRHKSGRPFTTWTIGFTQVCEQVMVMEAIYAFLSSHSVRCTIVRRGKNMKSSRGMVNVLIKHQANRPGPPKTRIKRCGARQRDRPATSAEHLAMGWVVNRPSSPTHRVKSFARRRDVFTAERATPTTPLGAQS
jgi:hypothetical protein